MVQGQPGSGKSRLVMETRKSLENQGWLFLRCKFESIVHAKPLSIMAGAFDKFLEQSIGLSRERKIREHLLTVMQPYEVSLLAKHVPAIAKYVAGSIFLTERVEVSFQQILRFHGLLPHSVTLAIISSGIGSSVMVRRFTTMPVSRSKHLTEPSKLPLGPSAIQA